MAMEELTDDELAQLLDEFSRMSPDETDAVFAKLTPTERERFVALENPSVTESVSDAVMPLLQGVGDVGVGFAKEAGQRVVDLSRRVGELPGVKQANALASDLTGIEPDPRLSQPAEEGFPELVPSNAAQRAGAIGEQVGEFFLPGRAVTAALTPALKASRLGRVLPSMNRTVGRQGGRFTPLSDLQKHLRDTVPRAVGEGVSSAGVAASQGSDTPEVAGALGALGPLVGAGAHKLLQMEEAPKALGLLGGGAMMKALGGPLSVLSDVNSIGLTMGTFGALKKAVEHLLKRPNAMRSIGNTLESGATGAGRLGAALQTEGRQDDVLRERGAQAGRERRRQLAR